MGRLPTLPGAVIPDGPLHPEDALFAFLAGILVAAMFARVPLWRPLALTTAAIWIFGRQYPNELNVSVTDHGSGALGLAAVVAVVVLSGTVLRRSGPPQDPTVGWSANGSAILGCAFVWAIVPDTEAPLIFAFVLVGGLLPPAVQAVRGRSHRHSWLAVVPILILPSLAALVGSRGRPERLWPALVAVTICAGVAIIVGRFVGARQRAGTPTTVAPGATSSTTTAPAPTTAP